MTVLLLQCTTSTMKLREPNRRNYYFDASWGMLLRDHHPARTQSELHLPTMYSFDVVQFWVQKERVQRSSQLCLKQREAILLPSFLHIRLSALYFRQRKLFPMELREQLTRIFRFEWTLKMFDSEHCDFCWEANWWVGWGFWVMVYTWQSSNMELRKRCTLLQWSSILLMILALYYIMRFMPITNMIARDRLPKPYSEPDFPKLRQVRTLQNILQAKERSVEQELKDYPWPKGMNSSTVVPKYGGNPIKAMVSEITGIHSGQQLEYMLFTKMFLRTDCDHLEKWLHVLGWYSDLTSGHFLPLWAPPSFWNQSNPWRAQG